MYFRNFIQKIKLPFRKDKELYRRLYAILGFYPKNIEFYKQALLHKSVSVKGKNGRWQNNERLEFLGDAILDAIVGHVVYSRFEGKREGFLTNARSKLVQRETLGKLAVDMGLDKLIRFNQTQHHSHNSYMAGNAFEALVGAIYLDYGYQRCMEFMEKRILDHIIDIEKVAYKEVNFKSKLLEWSQKNRIKLEFKDLPQQTDKTGSVVFSTIVRIEGLDCGQGTGYSKKESQQNASRETLKMLKQEKGFEEAVFEAKSQRTAMEEQPEALLPDIPEDLLSKPVPADLAAKTKSLLAESSNKSKPSLAESTNKSKSSPVESSSKKKTAPVQKAAESVSPLPQSKEDKVEAKVEAAAPEAEKVTPKTEKVAPKTEKVAPEAEKLAPEAEKLAPEAEKLAPEAEKLAPEAEKVVAPKAESNVSKADRVMQEEHNPQSATQKHHKGRRPEQQKKEEHQQQQAKQGVREKLKMAKAKRDAQKEQSASKAETPKKAGKPSKEQAPSKVEVPKKADKPVKEKAAKKAEATKKTKKAEKSVADESKGKAENSERRPRRRSSAKKLAAPAASETPAVSEAPIASKAPAVSQPILTTTFDE